MNYPLGIVLGVLLLVAVYHWFNQGKMGTVTEEEEGRPTIYRQNVTVTTGGEEEEGGKEEMGAAEMDMGEATYGTKQMPGGEHHYPMGGEQMGYPSGILPGKVGTFHPTKDCDRYICNGCWTCSMGGPGSCGAHMTDDRGRNYPELIDRIRAARTSEYPFYKLG